VFGEEGEVKTTLSLRSSTGIVVCDV
jgi:hypothetical protein